MRLDGFVAKATGLTRSQARKAIKSGDICLDGVVTKKAAISVADNQQVTLDGRSLSLPEFQYLMLHKPKGTVCATEDAEHPTVIDLLPDEVLANPKGELHPAGRLDRDTTGLVLISDNGHWTHNVTSPRKKCRKRYRVTLAEAVSDDAVEDLCRRFQQGVMLKGEDRPTLPAVLRIETPNQATVEISEGRYHQVKRMFAAVGNHVEELHRERIGLITLDKTLEPGEYRELTPEEIEAFC
ncbi:pseudouridine synthase [Motiliproteus sp. MSK22-1]|uniref:pseudouridine synthase n=1 Tax=Motiliproteus sp. MSK22-1 TaxID=1897630 RepID=UPI0009765DCD|nr:pseudouridine synthase [Motiliproteus sp. MSK22-1]OMH31799.1 16S rRNA pseudouridine(516) synthase [Motiliproteus sp. MSK22-1]